MEKNKPSSFVPDRHVGFSGIKAPGSPALVWYRDVGQCLPMLMKNSAILVENIYEGDEEALARLDVITKMIANMYVEARKDHTSAAANMSGLLVYASEDEKASAVFSAFCMGCVISVGAYLFSFKEMSVLSPDSLTQDVYDYNIFLQMWSMLPAEERERFLACIRSHSCLSSRLDLSPLFRGFEDYLAKIRQDQAAAAERTVPDAP